MIRCAALFTLACVLASTSPASAQFSAHPWSFSGSGSTGFSGGSVSGLDELTLEVLNCIGYAGSVRAESVAHDTGRYAFDLSGEEWFSADCSECGWGFCGGTTVWASIDCDECIFFQAPWSCELELSEEWGGQCAATWNASWAVEVVEGRCWYIAMAQDGWSLDCNTRLTLSNLTFTPAPDVTVTSITATPAYLSTFVRIRGLGLEHVSQVLVDDVDAPILSQTGTQIMIRPTLGPPGFSTVTLRNDEFLLAIESASLALLPTLSAQIPPDGQTLEVAVEAGVAGPWQMIVSLGTMPPFVLGPGTYSFLEVDVINSPWFLLPGRLDGSGLDEVTLSIPPEPGLSGLSASIQALTPTGFGASFTASFSNVAEVVVP